MASGGPPGVMNPPPAPASTEPDYYQYPSTIGGNSSDIDNYMMFTATNFKTQQRTLNVAMYIPGGALNTTYKSDYETVELGGLGAAAADTAKAVEKAASSGNFSVDSFMTLIGAGTSALASEGTSVGLLKAGAKMGDGARVIMEQNQGAVLNPFLTAAYKGPSDMRQHNFDFQMNPQNKDESKNCLKITNAFKKSMLPSHAGGDSTTAPSMLFGYPNTFEIDFYIDGRPLPKQNNPMFNIGKSVLTSCELNFDTENVPLFFAGTQYPVTISMKLAFMETEILYREKIDQGF